MGSVESPVPSPEFGRRLLVNVLDDHARYTPDKVIAIYARSGSKDLGAANVWRQVTFYDYARAVDRLAHLLISSWPAGAVEAARQSPVMEGLYGPTVAYIGPTDLRYNLLFFAAQKAGGQALFVSPRNTDEGQINLLKTTGGVSVWAPASHKEMVDSWVAASGVDFHFMPSLEDLLSNSYAGDSSPVPFNRTYDDAATDAALLLHTSGTTGLPKAIAVRNGMCAMLDKAQDPKELERNPNNVWVAWKKEVTNVLNTMPLFHMAGTLTSVFMPVFFEIAVVLPPADRPINTDLVEEALITSPANGVMMAPFIAEELSKTAPGQAALYKMNCIMIGGGALSKAAGDSIIQHGVKLCNIIGSTEAFPYPLEFQYDQKNWDYFVFRDGITGCDWRPVSGAVDNLFELVFVRTQPKAKTPDFDIVFWTFPHLTEWSTRDIFQRHPDHPNYYRYYSRIDNIIVFSNGEKLNPEDIELTVSRHPLVRGALVVGTNRFQAALLIEPQDGVDREGLLDTLWPTIEAANAATVAHGRVARPYVFFTEPGKPLPRAGKGTVQRKAALQLYAAEIDALYAKLSDEDSEPSAPGDEVVLDTSGPDALAKSIRDLFVTKLGVPPRLRVDTNFFSGAGVDSLQVMNAVRLLRKGLRASQSTDAPDEDSALGADLSSRIIYAYPTPAQLAAHILGTAGGADTNPEAEELLHMQTLIDRYSEDLPAAVEKTDSRPSARTTGQTIVVTGTTGSLGAYMLDVLLHESPGVAKVVALNRDADGGRQRQPRISHGKGLRLDEAELNDPSRIQFLHADLSKPRLGLSDVDYDALLADADRIIHNAWPVDFNFNVASFEPSIAGVRHLADFAAAAARRVVYLFISSIGTVENFTQGVPVPEAPLTDFKFANMGYGRSKLVSNILLDKVSVALHIPIVQVRLGQVGGPRHAPTTGADGAAWNRQELVPSVIASSVHLGALPSSLGSMSVVDWVPSEDAAHVVLEFAGAIGDNSEDINGDNYYTIVNPSARPFSELVPALRAFYGDRIRETVPFTEWVKRLEASGGDDVAANPAYKLLDRLRDMVKAEAAGIKQTTFTLTKSMERSPTLRTLGPVTGELVTAWCRQWAF